MQGCPFSVFFRYFWPDPKNTCMLIFFIFSCFIFLFLNFLSLFVFIFCGTARTRRFSVIFAKVQWHPWEWYRVILWLLLLFLLGSCLQSLHSVSWGRESCSPAVQEPCQPVSLLRHQTPVIISSSLSACLLKVSQVYPSEIFQVPVSLRHLVCCLESLLECPVCCKSQSP